MGFPPLFTSSATLAGSSDAKPAEPAPPVALVDKPKPKSPAKVSLKHVYDIGKSELKSRAEWKLSGTDVKLGVNWSDKTSVAGVDIERGAFKAGFDVQREDLTFQYKRKTDAGTFIFKQVVPGLNWALVPTPVVELNTKLVDGAKWKDKLKLVYDFQNRLAYYTETLKYNKMVKLRIGGDSKTSNHALCVGLKPDWRWLKSIKLLHSEGTGPIVAHKCKPVKGWKVHTEAALKPKVLTTSIVHKLSCGDAELVLEGALPLERSAWPITGTGWQVLRRGGVKLDVKF